MITVQKNDLLNAIKAVKNSTSKVDIQPILKCIHIKSEGYGLILTATDLSSSAQSICEANITEDIDICVNADKFENIITKLDEIINFKLGEQGIIEIQSGNTEFKLVYIQADEFPQITFNQTEDFVTLTKEEFINGVNKTTISTANNTTQGVFSGICFTFNNDYYELASTDGTRLSQIQFNTPMNKQGQFIIPEKILLDVAKNIEKEVTIYFEENTVIFKTNNCFFKQNLLNGKYPDYQKIIPQNQPLKAILNRNDLLHALEKVAVMCDERTNTTVFDFDNNKLKLTTACDNGNAKDIININFEGKNKIVLNYKFILEGLKVMNTENITFEMTDALSACVLISDFKYLIMPIKEVK